MVAQLPPPSSLGSHALTLAHIAAATGAVVRPGEAAQRSVHRLAPPDQAGPDALCFVRPSYRGPLSSKAGARMVESSANHTSFEGPLLVVPVLERALPRLLALFRPQWPAWDVASHRSGGGRWVSESARVAPDAQVLPGAMVGPDATIGPGAWIGPGAVIEPWAVVGEGCRVEAQAVVGWGCVVGARSRIGRGAVVGAEGFGLGGDGTHLPHVGRVVLGEEVELGALTVVDRATVGETTIGARCRLDNLVHVAHSVRLGPDCWVAAQVGIAGSTRIGAGVRIGGQAGIGGHLRVG
ncbi:MAG: UDP-3-O-(3-hydroxymyristoyl)glucosamine N-acyltransferase, partial [Myxococcota bacterium]